jgi:hypothetical protein
MSVSSLRLGNLRSEQCFDWLNIRNRTCSPQRQLHGIGADNIFRFPGSDQHAGVGGSLRLYVNDYGVMKQAIERGGGGGESGSLVCLSLINCAASDFNSAVDDSDV